MATRSMTGFGSAEYSSETFSMTVETKTLNSRFLEVALGIPTRFSSQEIEIRAIAQEYFTRGRVTVNVRFQSNEAGSSKRAFTQRFESALANLVEAKVLPEDDHGRKQAELQVALSVLGSHSSIAESEKTTPEDVALLLVQIRIACQQARESRAREGEKLQRVLSEILTNLSKYSQEASAMVPENQGMFATRLRQKLAQSLEQYSADDPRLMLEIALQVERSDCQEELDRLQSHIQEARALIMADDSKNLGKSLDFLAQEMARETSTLNTKVQGSNITGTARQLRILVEQLREQVQNIE